MDKRSKIILSIVALLFISVIAIKPLLQNRNAEGGGIDPNPDYSQALAEARAMGQPVFLEFYSDG